MKKISSSAILLSKSETNEEIYGHGRSSSSLDNTRKLQDIVKQRCRPTSHLEIGEALGVFDQVLDSNPKPPVSSFNSLLISVLGTIKKTHHQNPNLIISLFNKMNWVGGISPDDHTCSILIDCCSGMKRVGLGYGFFCSMIKRGWTVDVVALNSLINGLCKRNKVDDEAKLLDKMPQWGCKPDVVTYNTIIKGLCSLGAQQLSSLRR
ncbi:uncharacterized protein A4U43_C08F27890 [Asparagus officinalis]|uniref:pentatricopeptide repeat-containing protein At1g62680, mitochondrial-like n=1 Tax=Asparagus officinalis TaxID=4686 RepID=UPI00098E79F9|nr:pentatricopeptide repeat-containing protein At1g62680, mitochondrial-like [Asparagus officinalis]ONK61263.1 uncharacterized protein A4U43_C08F27890 [Asparagus officinalis]